MPQRPFSPGVRLSLIDVAVLGLAAVAALVLACRHFGISGLILFVVGHFCLFCNIVRMSRPLELAWASVFLLLAGGTILFQVPGWAAAYGLSLLMTIVVVLVEMRKPSYHGILWQRINPDLRDWWKANA